MTNNRRTLLLNAFKLLDLGIMIVAFMLAALAVLHQNHTVTITEFFSMRVKIHNLAIFGFLLLVWHLIFNLSGLYASRRLSMPGREVIDVIRSASLGTLVVLVGAIVFRIRLVTPLFLIVFWLVGTGTTVSS